MKRLAGVIGAILGVLFVVTPAVLAAEPLPHTGRVVVSTEGDVTIPAGEQADVVVVINGTAHIAGTVKTIVAVDGTIEMIGALAETVVAVGSPVTLGPGTVVTGDVMTVDALVHRIGNAEVQGEVSDIASALVGVSAVLVPALILFWIGFALATLVAALFLAGLAARQVRAAEAIISREPLRAFLAGVVGVIVVPVLAILLMITVVGAPLGLAILLGVWPLVAFLGYLVAAIWVGDWIIRQTDNQETRERPYLAAGFGVVALGVIGLVPLLNLVSAIASVVGFGAVLILGWRTLRVAAPTSEPAAGQVAVPATGWR
jgi:hypothetical protein